MTNKYYLWFSALISVIYIVLSLIYASNQVILDDQWYLYLNALDAAKNGNYSIVGQIVPGIGPTVGSVGNLLTSIPLMFSDSPWAPMCLIISLRLLSFVLFSIGLRHFFGNKTLCCFAVLYLLSPWFLYETSLTQTSYVIFGVSVVFLSLVSLYNRYNNGKKFFLTNPKTATFLSSTFLVLGLGFCFQLSYLSISLVIMVLLLLCRRALRISIPGIICGLAILFLTVWAFLSAILTSDEIGSMFQDAQQTTENTPWVLIETAARGILGWLRLGSTGYSHQMVRYFDPEIITAKPLYEVVHWGFLALVYSVGTITLLLNIYATFNAYKSANERIFSFRPIKDNNTFLCTLSFFAFFALLISSQVLPLRFQVINASTILVFALLPMLMLIEKWKNKPLHYFATALILTISFSVLINLACATSSQRFSQKSSMEVQLLDRFESNANSDDTKLLEDSDSESGTNADENNTSEEP